MNTLINATKTIVILGILMLITSSCDHEQGNDKYIKELEQKIVELKKELGQLDDSKPGNIIDPKFAAQLYNNYDTTRVKWTDRHIRQRSGQEEFNATRSLYYNLDSLHNYLAYIKRISKKAGVDPSGLRFYFGSYSSKYNRKGYAYRQTIFIAPTIAKAVGKDTMNLGYTLSDDFKVELLRDKIGTVARNQESGGGANMQKAGFFSISASSYGGNSTVANELTGTPPKGDQ